MDDIRAPTGERDFQSVHFETATGRRDAPNPHMDGTGIRYSDPHLQ